MLSYRSYWVDILLERFYATPKGSEISIYDISIATSITCDDILHTLNTLDLIKQYKSGLVILMSEKNIEYYEKSMSKKRVVIDESLIDWIPPKFHPNELRYI